MSTEPGTPETAPTVIITGTDTDANTEAEADTLEQRAEAFLAHLEGTSRAICDDRHLHPDTPKFARQWVSHAARVTRTAAGVALIAATVGLHAPAEAWVAVAAVILATMAFSYWVGARSEVHLKRIDHELWHDAERAERRFTAASTDAGEHSHAECADVTTTMERIRRQLDAASLATRDIRSRMSLAGGDDDVVCAIADEQQQQQQQQQLRLAAIRGILAIDALSTQLEVRQVTASMRKRSYAVDLIDDNRAVPALLEHAERRAAANSGA